MPRHTLLQSHLQLRWLGQPPQHRPLQQHEPQKEGIQGRILNRQRLPLDLLEVDPELKRLMPVRH